MSFKLQDKGIEQIVEKRRDISYYNITADWLNGFIEADGSFFETRGGIPFFQCTQHYADYALLWAIRRFIGEGKISKSVRDDGRSLAIYTVRGVVKFSKRKEQVSGCLASTPTKSCANEQK